MHGELELAVDGSMTFRLRDVFFPDAEDLVTESTSNLRVKGRVIDFSDSGRSKNRYAILEVEGIEGAVVVPVDRLSIPQ